MLFLPPNAPGGRAGRARARALLGVVALGCSLVWLAYAPAAAATNCEFGAGVMRVRMTTGGSSATIQVDPVGGTLILVNGESCGVLPPATVLNTNVIRVIDTTAGKDTGVIVDLSGGEFANSGTEIRFEINLGAGDRDVFAVSGSSGPDYWTFGTGGANLQHDNEAEIEFVRRPDFGIAAAREGPDRACANGGRGTGATTFFSWFMSGGASGDRVCGGSVIDLVVGGNGNDILRGFRSGDRLNGSAGDDRLFGARGIDLLRGQNGNDFLDGGSSVDTCRGGAGFDTRLHCEGG